MNFYIDFGMQRRIVAKVEQLMALVDALEQQFAASRATANGSVIACGASAISNPSIPGSCTAISRARAYRS